MSTNQAKLSSTIQALDPSGPWGTVGGIFDQIEICESVITKARAKYPNHDEAIWNSFSLLRPSKLLHEAPEAVYRAHCAELLERVIKSLDITLGTKAEIMMALSKASLRSPLTHTASVLYARLFREILPCTPVAAGIAQLATMAHDRETERLLAGLAQNTRVPDRKPKKESEWRTPPAQM